MKMIAEYLEHAMKFEELAGQEKNEEFKATLLKQAKEYRELAAKRALKLNLPQPPSESDGPR
jgi:hypothetical protein